MGAFAPHDLAYPSMQEHLSAAALGLPAQSSGPDSRGPWADVQDFNWHKRQASPNWCLLPQHLRRSPVKLEDAREEALRDPLPPQLQELERCQECWEAAEAGVMRPSHAAVQERADPAGPVVATKPALGTADRLDSDDEF